MRLRLEPAKGSQAVIELPTPSGEVTVGRGDKCVVKFNKSYVSRLHATLFLERDRCFLVPMCGDATLILVNARATVPHQRVELRAGDRLNFVQNSEEFIYDVREAPGPAQAAPKAEDPPTASPPHKRPRSTDTADLTPPSDDGWRDFECVICHGVLAGCHGLPCGHVSCGICLEEWLAQKPTCPLCNAVVAPGTLIYPVRVVDTIIETRMEAVPGDAGARQRDEVDDWRERSEAWRRRRQTEFRTPAAPAAAAAPQAADRAPLPTLPPAAANRRMCVPLTIQRDTVTLRRTAPKDRRCKLVASGDHRIDPGKRRARPPATFDRTFDSGDKRRLPRALLRTRPSTWSTTATSSSSESVDGAAAR
ncbi:hypothetical protein M885DRAFT_523943 [Pelagophyceae sp. CCMP2097]|nr:hypothetical protein M885DRAFT_523943 [Pelagophyceae sp. CCMP2097]